jgi:hypothetical protein
VDPFHISRNPVFNTGTQGGSVSSPGTEACNSSNHSAWSRSFVDGTSLDLCASEVLHFAVGLMSIIRCKPLPLAAERTTGRPLGRRVARDCPRCRSLCPTAGGRPPHHPSWLTAFAGAVVRLRNLEIP